VLVLRSNSSRNYFKGGSRDGSKNLYFGQRMGDGRKF